MRPLEAKQYVLPENGRARARVLVLGSDFLADQPSFPFTHSTGSISGRFLPEIDQKSIPRIKSFFIFFSLRID